MHILYCICNVFYNKEAAQYSCQCEEAVKNFWEVFFLCLPPVFEKTWINLLFSLAVLTIQNSVMLKKSNLHAKKIKSYKWLPYLFCRLHIDINIACFLNAKINNNASYKLYCKFLWLNIIYHTLVNIDQFLIKSISLHVKMHA